MKTIAINGKIIPLFITALCLFFFVPNNVTAQDKQVKNVKTVKVEAKEIKQDNKDAKLTDDQKTKMKDLRAENMKAIQILKAQGQELKAHLKTLNIAEKPDNKAIFKTIDELTANQGEIMKRMITFRQASKALLTPEQLKALELRGGMGRGMGMGGRDQNFRNRGNRNFGGGQMMRRGGMNRPGQMMRGGGMNRPGQMMQRGGMNRPGQMQPGGMNRQGQMMQNGQMQQREIIIRKGGQDSGGQMMPQGQMQRRFQIIRDGHPVSDSTKIK